MPDRCMLPCAPATTYDRGPGIVVGAAVMLALVLGMEIAAAQALPVNTDSLPVASDSVALAELVEIRSLDSTIQVDLRYAGAGNFTGAPLPGYEAPKAWLRREAAVALVRVQRRLKTGDMGLLIFDAYRPVRATRAMVEWASRTGSDSLLRLGYIASRSRHNLGLAVDLTLVDRVSGTVLDMGTTFDTFSDSAHTANAGGRVLRYRLLLVKMMEAEGFTNYDQEWWHFTYDLPGALPFDLPIR